MFKGNPKENEQQRSIKMKKIRMIALDLDGTVFDGDKKVTKRTQETLEEAIRQGIVVFPCTGRPWSGIPEEIRRIRGLQYAVTSNGARILKFETGETIRENCLSHEKTMELIDAAIASPEGVWEIYVDGKCYADADTYRFIQAPDMSQAQLDYIRKSRILVKNLRDWAANEGLRTEKLHMMFERTDLRDRCMEKFQKFSGIDISYASTFNLEINDAGCSKGRGILDLAEHLGIDRDEIMACGDSRNDWPMLRDAGFAVAMGNADEDTKKLADFVTKSNEEDGVAYAVEKFVLNTQQQRINTKIS